MTWAVPYFGRKLTKRKFLVEKLKENFGRKNKRKFLVEKTKENFW